MFGLCEASFLIAPQAALYKQNTMALNYTLGLDGR